MAEYYAESQPTWLLPPKTIAEIEAESFQVGRAADPHEANWLGTAARWAWNGGKYVWKNTSFDGPSPGAYYLNGRIVGVRWKQSQFGVRLDVHPLPGSAGRPVLHLNYGPPGKGEASHVVLFDPNWLGRQ